jgi:hypothetical protein
MRIRGLMGKIGRGGSGAKLVLQMGLYDGDYPLEWLGGVLGDIGVTHFRDLAYDDPGANRNSAAAQRYTLVVHAADVTRGRKLSAPQTVVGTDRDLDNAAVEAMACVRPLLDNVDRYYVDGVHQAATIFMDFSPDPSRGPRAHGPQQETLFSNGQSAARAWVAAQVSEGRSRTS